MSDRSHLRPGSRKAVKALRGQSVKDSRGKRGPREIHGPGAVAQWSDANQAYLIRPFKLGWSEAVLDAAPVLAVRRTADEARRFMRTGE